MKHVPGKILFLGTGASTGVPVIGCSCRTCCSSNSRNKRLRSGILFAFDGKIFLMDVGPDFRQQALLYGIERPSAVFLTHTHYDHVGGLEELRAFSYHEKEPIPCYLSQASFESVQKMFYYLFLPKTDKRNKTAEFDFRVIAGNKGELDFEGAAVKSFAYSHGGMPVFGYRFGNVAYISDMKEFSDEIFSFLQGVEILIMSATCLKHSHLHMTVDEAVAFVQKISPQKTYFVHLSHEIEHDAVSSLLPAGMALAYDGLSIEYMWKGL